MKSLLERITWVKIVEGILLVILGILIAVLGGLYAEEIGNALAISVAVFLFIDGLLTLFGFLLDPKSNFSFTTVLGCLFITIGVLLCINTSGDGIGQLIGMFVAILLLTCGVVYLIKGCIQISIKAPVGWIIINFLIAIIGITLGIVSIIYYVEYLKIVFIVIGVAVSTLGCVDLIFSIIKYRRKLKENAKVQDQVVAEATGDEVIIEGEIKNDKKKDKKDRKIKRLGHKKTQLLTNNVDPLEDQKDESSESNDSTNDDSKDEKESDNIIEADVK